MIPSEWIFQIPKNPVCPELTNSWAHFPATKSHLLTSNYKQPFNEPLSASKPRAACTVSTHRKCIWSSNPSPVSNMTGDTAAHAQSQMLWLKRQSLAHHWTTPSSPPPAAVAGMPWGHSLEEQGGRCPCLHVEIKAIAQLILLSS
jgi:hypothetical protein